MDLLKYEIRGKLIAMEMLEPKNGKESTVKIVLCGEANGCISKCNTIIDFKEIFGFSLGDAVKIKGVIENYNNKDREGELFLCCDEIIRTPAKD
jgi:hypothetical protein